MWGFIQVSVKANIVNLCSINDIVDLKFLKFLARLRILRCMTENVLFDLDIFLLIHGIWRYWALTVLECWRLLKFESASRSASSPSPSSFNSNGFNISWSMSMTGGESVAANDMKSGVLSAEEKGKSSCKQVGQDQLFVGLIVYSKSRVE